MGSMTGRSNTQLSGHAVRDRFLDTGVVVPAFGAAVHNGHQANAGFDETAGEHELAVNAEHVAAARVLVLAVELGHGVGLAIERERLAGFGRTDELVGLLIELAHGIELGGVRFDLAEVIFEGFTGGAAAIIVDQLELRGITVRQPSGAVYAELAAAGFPAAPAPVVDLTLAGTRYEPVSTTLSPTPSIWTPGNACFNAARTPLRSRLIAMS